MSLPDWNAFLKAQPAVAALVSDRIYPLLIPHHVYARVTQNPAIVYQRTGISRSANYCETERIVIGSYQFDCYGRRYADALALAKAVRLALRDFVGLAGECDIRLTRQDSDRDEIAPEPGLYVHSTDWSVWYIESASAP